MKKLCMVFAAVMTAITVWLCASCGTDGMKDVSERRSGYFTATADGFAVTAVSGVREEQFASDGKAGKLKPYTLITLVPTDFDMDDVITYTVEMGGSTFGGTMIVHPFAASFSAEIDCEAKSDFTLDVRVKSQRTRVELKSAVTKDMISYDKAITAAKAAVAPRGEYEIRARLIKNPLGGEGICWHINFISASGETGVLLDPTTAKVLAKK